MTNSLPDLLIQIRSLLENGSLEKSKKQIQKASAIDPNNLDLAVLQGIFYLMQQQYMKAATVLHWVTTQRDNDFLAWHNLGITFRFLGSLKEAKLALQKAESLKPNDDLVHFELSSIFAQQQEYIAALLEVETALKLRPDKIDYYKTMANLLIAIGDWHSAIGICKSAQSRFPDHPEFLEQINRLSELNYY